MTSYRIRTESQRDTAIADLRATELPARMELHTGDDRSQEQNRLSWLWYGELARSGHLDPQWHPVRKLDAEDAHRECKLRCGVPILREVSEDFRATYDRLLRPLPEADKCEAMKLISITSLLTVPQMVRYLDSVWQKYAIERGAPLTQPVERGRAAA